MIMKDNNEISNIFIVADRVVVEAGDELHWALIMLMLCYYVWDLAYRKHYQILGFLQTYVLEDRESTFLCQETILNSLRSMRRPEYSRA